ncbi:hypothetical protein FUAX_17850 [Fulvitalea axinellae]|uniref:TonB C-terminal domain-containing protein n=2 Tax=Fulvitalea axinellae TaxID=1182444 RepID=A0AAU9D067_9BACT|nr:hypothetical protein FUAX_17850 [Fulvitalea axinellae]
MRVLNVVVALCFGFLSASVFFGCNSSKIVSQKAETVPIERILDPTSKYIKLYMGFTVTKFDTLANIRVVKVIGPIVDSLFVDSLSVYAEKRIREERWTAGKQRGRKVDVDIMWPLQFDAEEWGGKFSDD